MSNQLNVTDILEAVTAIRGTDIPDLKHALDIRFDDDGNISYMTYWTNSPGAAMKFESQTGLETKPSTTGYFTKIKK